jgi:hypothetical protein
VNLPESCWRGIFSLYREAVDEGVAEAPNEYHFACLATLLGAVIGRRRYVWNVVRLYPMLYSVLVGPTGLGKTSMLWVALDGLGVRLATMRGLSSAEGLIEELREIDSHNVTVIQDEFMHILAKAKQEATGTLLPMLNQLYDAPEFAQVRTRNNPLRVDAPALSLLAGTTPEWMTTRLEDYHFTSGFMNRINFYVGDSKPAVALARGPDFRRVRKAVQVMITALAARPGPEQVQLDDDAKKEFVKYYDELYSATHGNELVAHALNRQRIQVLKLALVYAVSERSRTVQREHITAAADWSRYQHEVVGDLFGGNPLGPSRHEERVLRILSQSKGPIKRSDLHRKMGGQTSAAQLTQMLDALAKVDRVVLGVTSTGARIIGLAKEE